MTMNSKTCVEIPKAMKGPSGIATRKGVNLHTPLKGPQNNVHQQKLITSVVHLA